MGIMEKGEIWDFPTKILENELFFIVQNQNIKKTFSL